VNCGIVLNFAAHFSATVVKPALGSGPDPPEALKCVPTLNVSDIDAKNKTIQTTRSSVKVRDQRNVLGDFI